MKKPNFIYVIAFTLTIVMIACTHDQIITEETSTDELQWKPSDGIAQFIPSEYKDNIRAEDIEYAERILLNSREKTLESRGNQIVIPAGSSNALTGAIASAEDGDVIILEPGDHTQSGTVVINKYVSIIGYGANLIFSGTSFSPTLHISPGLHITDKGWVSTIQGITFKSTDTIPGVAVFVEHSRSVKIVRNKFENWVSSILLYQSDYCTIGNNTIAANLSWQTGIIPLAQGIVLSDGSHNQVIRNEVSGAVMGIFTGGSLGLSLGNIMHQNVFGHFMCKLTPGVLTVAGTLINTENTTSNWLVIFNSSDHNILDGYLVVDGASRNLLQHNKADNNGVYDIELQGATTRFGYPTPTSFNNTVVVASSVQIIKNCGDNNKVIGGTIESNVTVPCN
ncbi:MAG: right-handed parallel beta-helix repeat-containing protein [Saprospiraceae bacterium]